MYAEINRNKDKQIKRHETYIDALKGIAIFGVVMVHSGIGALSGIFGKIAATGTNGVQMFLIITAYLSWKSLNSKRMKDKTTITWMTERFFRIAPLYYISIFVYLIVLGIGKRYWLGSFESVSIWNIFSHLLFINGFHPFYNNSILGVEWYIAAIVPFYFLAVLFRKKIDALEKSIIGLSICSLSYFVLRAISRRVSFGENDYIWRNFMDGFSVFRHFRY